jgi:hypothetical protein
MGKHENKNTGDGQGNFDPSKTKDVQDAGGGRHSGEDKGDQGGQGDEGDDKE